MDKLFNYRNYFDTALQNIKYVRAPHAKKIFDDDLKWSLIRQQDLFCFGDEYFEKHANIIRFAKNISLRCIHQIIIDLLKSKKIKSLTIIHLESVINKDFNIRFAFKDECLNEIIFFCDILDSCIWKEKNRECEEIETFLKKHNAVRCKYVFLMFDYAYMQIIGHNNDETDPGRGYNFYSLKWFFENYFDENEYIIFKNELIHYTQQVNLFLGYNTVKSLTPSALINFKKITENTLLNFPFENLKNIRVKDKDKRELYLSKEEYEKMHIQFSQNKTYLIMLGETDFAESLITAEWLYDSMKKSQAIDLTAIGMGYFKSVEQLLYSLICLHKEEKRNIKEKKSQKKITLNDENIQKDNIDTTLGSMAYFYKDNLEILREELTITTKKFIKENIFIYSNLRNGYFHKHNIHSWDKIEQIRNVSLNMIFLLLGGQTLSAKDLQILGFPNSEIFSDYYRLCEYINFHSNEFFIVKDQNKIENILLSINDPDISISSKKEVLYSGVYLRDLYPGGKVYKLTEDNLPSEIYLAKNNFGNGQEVKFDFIKSKKIFENGKFLGRNIAEDDSFDY